MRPTTPFSLLLVPLLAILPQRGMGGEAHHFAGPIAVVPGGSGTSTSAIAVSVKTSSGNVYAIQATDSPSPTNWTFVASGIVGTGELQQVEAPIDPGANTRHYRLLATTHAKVGQRAELINRYHGVGGTCTITDENTIEISNFHFDGQGINVQVYVSPDSSFSPYASLTGNLIRPTPYVGETMILNVPGGIDEVNYLSIWCVPAGVSFGDAHFVP